MDLHKMTSNHKKKQKKVSKTKMAIIHSDMQCARTLRRHACATLDNATSEVLDYQIKVRELMKSNALPGILEVDNEYETFKSSNANSECEDDEVDSVHGNSSISDHGFVPKPQVEIAEDGTRGEQRASEEIVGELSNGESKKLKRHLSSVEEDSEYEDVVEEDGDENSFVEPKKQRNAKREDQNAQVHQQLSPRPLPEKDDHDTADQLILPVLQEYCKKPAVSKFDPAHSFILDLSPSSKIEGKFGSERWAELIADRPSVARVQYHEEIKSICDHLFGSSSEKKRSVNLRQARAKWKELRNLQAPKYCDDFSYNEEDWEKILYWVERAVGQFLDAFEAERNPIQQTDCHEREWWGDYFNPIFQGALKLCGSWRVPWGEITVLSSLRRRNKNKNILEDHLQRGHQADLMCICDQNEVVCGLACGGPHNYDLTKQASDEYHLPRLLKDMLDVMIENFGSKGKDPSDLYTIGIQLYMTEVRIYMMEKREVYRLHLLKSFNLPLSHSSYGNLRQALSWAWNIRGLVRNMWLELDDSTDVSPGTPHRYPRDNLSTMESPTKPAKKKKN